MKHWILLFVIGAFSTTPSAFGQKQKTIKLKAAKYTFAKVGKHTTTKLLRPDSVAAFEIGPKDDTINVTDIYNLRQGFWLERKPERFGEDAYTLAGYYVDNWKQGLWKTFVGPNLVAEENFTNDVRNGEVRYYENGFLNVKGYYNGSNHKYVYDTIDIENAQTQEVKRYIATNENYSDKDSTWTFYYSNGTKIAVIQHWRNDDLLKEEDFVNQKPDSVTVTKMMVYEKSLPHNNKKPAPVPFANESKGKHVEQYIKNGFGKRKKG